MFRCILLVGSLGILNIGFSFALDNKIYCVYPEAPDFKSCKQNEKNIEVPELQVKDIQTDEYGNGIGGSIYYNNQLLRKNEYFSPLYFIKYVIDKENKNIFLYNGDGGSCKSLYNGIEKIGFDGTSHYTISYRGILNPIITLETEKYTTTIYFSDKTKNYIAEPTSKNRYTGLYMKKVAKDTKKVTVRTLYSFSPIAFKDECGLQSPKQKFNISPESYKETFGINGKYYTFQTNTRKIQLDLTDTGKSIITRIK